MIIKVSKVRTILLKLAGPLQSWGTNSHFETRHTDLYPSKSGILGIVAGSLGLKRDDNTNIKKLNELLFATRIDQEGMILRDFQISAKYKANGTFERNYVSNRYYLSDAIFIVSLSHEDKEYIQKIYQALKKPYFQQFMGRRSLPVNYDFIISVEDEEPIKLLKEIPWQANKYYQSRHSNELTIYADKKLIDNKTEILRKDNVLSFSQKNREFEYRTEGLLKVKVEKNDIRKTAHDVWDAIGD